MSRPTLLLDVMGTLVHDPFYEAIPQFLGMTMDELLRVKHPTAWVEFERNEIDERALVAKFFSDGRALDGDGLKRAMRRAYRWIEGIEPLLTELRARGVAMHTLSNYPLWYQLIEQELGLSRYLPWTFVSCKTGVRKPDPEAYVGAARTLGVDVGDCLFVDDRAKNCVGARKVGMDAIEFRDAPAMRAALIDRGVL